MLAILAMLARRGALRVVPGSSAPLFPFVARHGLGVARSGRLGREERTKAGAPVEPESSARVIAA